MADKVLKHIPEQKLKAFSIGTMGRRQPSKKEIEESKKKEQEKAAAQAFEEFVATFQEVPNKTGKVWVKAGTYDAGKRQEDTKEKGKLYKPQSRLDKDGGCSSAEKAQEYAKLLGDRVKPDKPGKKKEKEKKKSNLELFKEELKLIQEEREERHKYKGVVKSNVVDPEVAKGSSIMAEDKGSFDSGDPNTTNIYLGNINPKITEQQLMEVFGKYGPLASIKIMWPRSDEEKSRGRNCGFVAFMNRRDGDRAMKALNGKDVLGYEMKLGWGKGVPIPPYPIYIPPTLLSLTQPPPPSGLPFNAQPHPKDKHKVPKMRPNEPYPENPDDQDKVEKILPQALVKVVMPTDRNLLMLIHHMIEYVIREGPMFEAMIMNREISNPLFRFLFDNQSPAHAYYRWKLFSLLQGDSQKEWCLQEFRMFKGGSVWRPPPMNLYTQGMPDELIEKDDDRKGGLSPAQRDRLEHLIRSITPGRLKVADAMVFCIEHSDAADEICDCIVESLSNPDTVIYKKIARLYLVSDILHNCGLKITNASFYRRCLESRLPDIFLQAHLTFTSLDSRLKAEAFRVRVMSIFSAWEDWAIYPKDFLHRLKRTFLGSLADEEESDEVDTDKECSDDERRPPDIPEPEPDGEDLDGIPLDGAALLKSAFKHTAPPPQALSSDDLDGIPMDDDLDGKPMEDEEGSPEPIVEATEIMLGVSGPSRDSMVSGGSSPPVRRPPPPPGAFVPSRWETVDPELIEAQAMTTSKWEMLEQQQRRQVQQQQIQQQQQQTPQDQQQQVQPHPLVNLIKEDDQQSTPQQEDVEETSLDSCRDLQEEIRRAKLREIELKVIQYQDELESGKRILKPGFTFPEQIEHHRKKLLRKAERADKERTVEKMSRKSSGSPDGSSESKCRRRKSKSSSYSPPSKRSHNRSRSRSPFSARKSRRSSRSPRKDSPESKRRKGVVSPRIAGSKRRGSSIEGASSPPGSHSKRRGSGSTSPRRGRSRSRRSQSPLTLPHRRRRTPSSTSPPPPSSHRGKHSKRSESSSSSSKRHKHKHRH